ncbi:DgyrCDS7662 [Dimorphilus gyrociliatus]|nr:DgyrCDS7662 [Dimorphilus gyrociliatus]
MENSAKIIHDRFLIVTELDSSTLTSLKYYLVRSIGTNKYFALKTLTLSADDCSSKDENGGKQLIYTEHQILSMLSDVQGVSHEYGIVREDKVIKGKNYKIISLVLDPFTYYYEMPHKDGLGVFINMQHYILGKRTLPQQEALFLFRELCLIVQQLHNKNIIHRDLKLGNILYYKKQNKVILIHFCLSKALTSSDEELNDQKGSPVYMSPESLSGKPYCGKKSEIWSLGVILYTLLFGQFPFMDENPQDLFRKIKHVAFEPPNKPSVSTETINILKGIFKKDPKQRSKIRDILRDISKALDKLS